MTAPKVCISKQKIPHRCRRFTLRALLIAVTVLCICFGWPGLRIHQAEIQHQSIDGLLQGPSSPGCFGYSYQYSDDGMDARIRPAIPGWILHITGPDFFYDCVYINLNGAGAKAAQFQHLEGLKRLKYLGLDNAEITKQMTETICGMRELEGLSMQFCDLTDEKLRGFAGLKALKSLQLTYNNIGDEALKYLGDLGNLHSLRLQHNRVADSGLPRLARLSKLESLAISENGGSRTRELKACAP
jgi:hypothetical protein